MRKNLNEIKCPIFEFYQYKTELEQNNIPRMGKLWKQNINGFLQKNNQ